MAIGLFRKAASQPPPTAPAPAGSRCDRSRRRTTRAFPHKRTHSHPQRPGDVAWNTANSRNQRTYLIQSYARDMGGGNTVLMREIDVPIRVNGRHWGGFRTAYKL
jgi:hypothetical protein